MTVKRIEAVNDFVIQFANVNGSGSASANELFARSFLRMGVPVSPRNIFPSNIQGLPTWYEVRVTEKGHLGRRGGIDLLVAMNPQTWDADVASIESGGYLLYDSTKALPASKFRADVHAVGVPLTEMCNAAYDDPRERQLLKNIMYVGVLASLLGLDPAVVAELIGEQYRGKEKLLKPNLDAFRKGWHYAEEHLENAIGLRARRTAQVGDRIFVDGNSALALGFVYGGATVCAWYPITPSSSVADAFTRYCAKLRVDPESGERRYAIVQAEDELAAVGVVVGAGWNGARAFTATSGPGISLMTEFIGLAYFAEIPVTIVDVQRGGPSTGMPTRTQQSDLLACAYASHGDTKHVLLFPEDPRECFDFAALALDLADRLQTPIFVMTDLDIGMNQRLCAPFAWDDARRYDRGKVMRAEALEAGAEFGRYLDVDGDGVPYRTLPGTHPTKGAYFTRGTTKDAYAQYSERGADYVENVQRLLRKFDLARSLVPHAIERRASAAAPDAGTATASVPPSGTDASPAAPLGAIFYGSTSPAMAEAVESLAAIGCPLDTLRVRAFPFGDEVRRFIDAHETVFVVEQNRDGQLRTMLVNELGIDPARLQSVLHYDGTPITARFIADAIAERMRAANVRPLKRTTRAPKEDEPNTVAAAGGRVA